MIITPDVGLEQRLRVACRQTGWISADLAELGPSRNRLSDWLAGRIGAEHEQIMDITLVFSELLTNAIEGSPRGDEVSYSYSDDAELITIRIVNQNVGEVPVMRESMPEPEALAGRGLVLAQELADRVVLSIAGRQVEVTAQFILLPL